MEHNKHTSDTTHITSESETQRAKKDIYHQSYNRIVHNATRTSGFIFIIQDYHELKATKDGVFQAKVALLSKDEHLQQLHVSIQPPYISFLLYVHYEKKFPVGGLYKHCKSESMISRQF